METSGNTEPNLENFHIITTVSFPLFNCNAVSLNSSGEQVGMSLYTIKVIYGK